MLFNLIYSPVQLPPVNSYILGEPMPSDIVGEKLWIQNKVSCNMAPGLICTYDNTGYVTDSLGLRFFFLKIVGNNTWFTRVLKGI